MFTLTYALTLTISSLSQGKQYSWIIFIYFVSSLLCFSERCIFSRSKQSQSRNFFSPESLTERRKK